MTDDEIQDRLNHTVAVVQATHTEKHFLWMEWSTQSRWMDPSYPDAPRKLTWEQMEGCWLEIGEVGILDPMPVCLSLTWVRIQGQVVLFWELTSTVADYRMAEKWFDAHFKPWPTYNKGSRRACFDAMNFHNAAFAIRQAAGIDR